MSRCTRRAGPRPRGGIAETTAACHAIQSSPPSSLGSNKTRRLRHPTLRRKEPRSIHASILPPSEDPPFGRANAAVSRWGLSEGRRRCDSKTRSQIPHTLDKVHNRTGPPLPQFFSSNNTIDWVLAFFGYRFHDASVGTRVRSD